MNILSIEEMAKLSREVQIEEKAASWKRASSKVKDAEEALKIARDELIAVCDGQDFEGYGVKVERVERKGSIEYKAIPQLADVNLNDYRKPSTTYFMVIASVKE